MAKLQYRPNGKRLLVTRKKHELKTKAGILLPDNVAEKILSEGYVERIGPDCNETWSVGMHVIFAQFAGNDISIDEEDYVVIPEEDILVYKEE